MSEKKIEKVAFWLSVISTEIVLYLVILLGVGIMFYGVFKTIHLLPITILAAMIEVFSVWKRHMEGFYARAYKEHVCKEGVW